MTDHAPLKALVSTVDMSNDRLYRWAIFLSQFQMEIIHRGATHNRAMDLLSRLPTKNQRETTNSVEWVNTIANLESDSWQRLNKAGEMMQVFDDLEETGEFKMYEYMHPIVSRPMWIYATEASNVQPEDIQTDANLKQELGDRVFEQIEQIRKAQWKDDSLRPIMQYKMEQVDSTWTIQRRDSIRTESLKYDLIYGMLYYVSYREDGNLKLVVAKTDRAQLMHDCHSTPTSGHMGKLKV
jgi:hypothetical protein